MSHNIEFHPTTGKPMIAYVGETPWHGLGTEVPADLTPQQMLEAAGLDWTVSCRNQAYIHDERYMQSGDQALVRDLDGKWFCGISEGWFPAQNHLVAEFFHEFVMRGNMEMHSAGSLQDGRIVWFLAKTKDGFDLKFHNKVDTLENYLLFTNYHIYGRSNDLRNTTVRVICNNTHDQALSKRGDLSLKINHRSEFDPVQLQQAVEQSHKRLMEYKEKAEFLASRKADPTKIEYYLGQVFPSQSKKGEPSRLVKQAMEVLHAQPGAELGEGTWWQPFNAVTFMIDHMQGRSDHNRLYSAWYGPNRDRKEQALVKAVEMANVS